MWKRAAERVNGVECHPAVEQEFNKRGQQFSEGSGQWTASDGYFSGEYPDGKRESSSYSTYEESGKIKWNDFSKSTEKAYDNRNPLVAITISADDIDSDEGHGKYENKSHSNSTFVKLSYADPGTTTHDQGSSESLTREGVTESKHSKTEVSSGQITVNLIVGFFMNVPSGTHTGSYTRTIVNATKTESSAETNSYTATAAGGGLERWGDAKHRHDHYTRHHAGLRVERFQDSQRRRGRDANDRFRFGHHRQPQENDQRRHPNPNGSISCL
jgi:hypothetical protein